MDMGRLTSLVGVEVKTERSDAQNCRIYETYHMQRCMGIFFANVTSLPPAGSAALIAGLRF